MELFYHIAINHSICSQSQSAHVLTKNISIFEKE